MNKKLLKTAVTDDERLSVLKKNEFQLRNCSIDS